MKVVILDGAALLGHELNWDSLNEFVDLIAYDRTEPDEIVQRCRLADVIVTNKAHIDADIIQQLPNLKAICVTATGYNNIDTRAANQRGIVVSNVPAYSTPAVAQHVFAMLLAYIHQPERHHEAVQAGQWVQAPDFSFWLTPSFELQAKTIGIVGLGQIGSRVAEIANAFGMRILVASRSRKNQADYSFPFEQISLEVLFAQSDVVTLHCPQTEQNFQFIDGALIRTMRPHAILINTARGTLIHEHQLAEALAENVIAGALLDVISSEPMKADNPLLNCPNCLLTPHNAWSSLEARQRCLSTTIENVTRFVAGNPQNVVS